MRTLGHPSSLRSPRLRTLGHPSPPLHTASSPCACVDQFVGGMANEADFKFRSQFWAAYAPEPEPEPELEPELEPGTATCPPTRNRIVLQGHGRSRPALELTVDELTLDDVEKEPSGNWTLAQYSGLMLWDAATIFARWMHRYAAQVFAGRSVLELGAGSTGLPGLTAHLLGARNVVLSDHIPELVQSLRANIRRCQEGVAARHVKPYEDVRVLDASERMKVLHVSCYPWFCAC